MFIGESGENYLEAIYILEKEQGLVRSIDVALFLGVTKPSVSRAMSNLKAQKLVDMPADGGVVLTDEGRKLAESVYERHELITEFLVTLGVSRETAAEDACRMEHVISEETFACLREHAREQMGEQKNA